MALAPSVCGFGPGDGARDRVDLRPESLGHGLTRCGRLAANVRDQSRCRAAFGDAVAVSRRQIGVEVVAQAGADIVLIDWIDADVEDVGDRLGDQVILGLEVSIETPMGQPGGLHDLRHAHRIEPLLPEQSTGGVCARRRAFPSTFCERT